MSVTLATGSAQTVSGATLTPKAPDLGSYAWSVDDPGAAVMSNIDGALDQPNQIRYSVAAVADVFKASPVNPGKDQRTDGINVLVQVTEVWKVTDDVANTTTYLPVSGHIVLKLPIDASITADAVKDLIARVTGSVVRGASGTIVDGLAPLLHGVTRIPDPPST